MFYEEDDELDGLDCVDAIDTKDTHGTKKPLADLDDDWLYEEERPRTSSEEDRAAQEAKILAMFAERERIKREGLFVASDGKEYKKPLDKEQFFSLNVSDRCELRRITEKWQSTTPAHKPAEPEMLAAALGVSQCPACQDKRTFGGISFGLDTGYREPNGYIRCWCNPYRIVQNECDRLVGDRYRTMDFRSSNPSKLCRLPIDLQQANWDEVRAALETDKKAKAEVRNPKDFQPHNFFFAGSAGSGKTTLSSMIAREAIWRDLNVEGTGIEYCPKPIRWVWVVDAEELFIQFADWATSRTSEHPAPEPVVSVRKIEKASSLGCTPTIVLEELDKGRLTEPRFTFLFNLMNAMAKSKGQLIITTNRKIDRFMALFTESESETIRTSGEPLMRRFLENNCIKQFTFIS
jgi:DNA replication protein DnaC